MTELEKIAYAKSFIDKLANGINPLDDTHIPDDDIVNNVRLSRCFFYVSSILQREIEREQRMVPKKKQGRAPFSITPEQLQKFEYSPYPISVSAMGKKINWLVREDIEEKRMEKFSCRKINYWLCDIGMIEWREWNNGKLKRFPTVEGEAIGLVLEIWENYGRRSPVIYLSEEAQHFIIDNIEAVMATKKESISPATEEYEDESCEVTEKEPPKDPLKNSQIGQEPKEKTETEPKLCRNCRFQLSGECSSWDPCDDFQPIYRVSKSEMENWPTEGDATRFKQKWKKDDWSKD